MSVEIELGLGATGEFPQGKLNDGDEGELRLAIGVENENVVVRFGKPVSWIGMDRSLARAFAHSILAKAEEIT